MSEAISKPTELLDIPNELLIRIFRYQDTCQLFECLTLNKRLYLVVEPLLLVNITLAVPSQASALVSFLLSDTKQAQRTRSLHCKLGVSNYKSC